MKKFIVYLDVATITKHGTVLDRKEMPVAVLAENRGGAIIAGLDVGQAISRSANCSNGEVAIFFRATQVIEREVI